MNKVLRTQAILSEFVRPGPTVRPASLPPAGRAGRRQSGSRKVS